MSSFAAVLAVTLSLQAAPAPVQDPVAAEPSEPVALEDVIVEGATLERLTRNFVREVGAPPPRRGLARWRGRVCVGVANMQHAVAEPLIDHISRMARDHSLAVGDPGCRPNILIIFTDDARTLATRAVAEDRRFFHLGVGGLDRGNSALRTFQESDAAVRWWHVSMPTISSSGAPAINVNGLGPPQVPGEGIVNRGRPIRDDLSRVVIIVDMDQAEGLTLAQLGDYLGLVALAQSDPEADTSRYETVLNLFADRTGIEGLSGWDQAYLNGLYSNWPWQVKDTEQTYQMLRRLRRDREAAAEAEN